MQRSALLNEKLRLMGLPGVLFVDSFCRLTDLAGTDHDGMDCTVVALSALGHIARFQKSRRNVPSEFARFAEVQISSVNVCFAQNIGESTSAV
jgi:hypothetical protein